MKFRKPLNDCQTTLLITTEVFKTLDGNQFPPVHMYFPLVSLMLEKGVWNSSYIPVF